MVGVNDRGRVVLLCVLVFYGIGCTDPVPKGTQVVENVAYAPGIGADLLNLYVPKSDRPDPLVIWIHGGGWQIGNGWRGHSPAMRLLAHGYAVANIDYRLTGQARFPAQIQDCRAAVRWLRSHAGIYHIDSQRVGIWGESAGGHLAALLGTSGDSSQLEANEAPAPNVSARVQAVCDWYGPTDFLQIVTDKAAKDNPSLDAPGSPLGDLLGGRVSDHLELARLASPISFVGSGDPPFLIFHGDRDPIVPIHQSELLEKALSKAGDDVTFCRVEGGWHGGWEFDSAENQAIILRFFDRVLKGDAPPVRAPVGPY